MVLSKSTNLTFAVILPHVKIYGGVKRFLEIGNILIRKGHDFIIFTNDGVAPEWFDFHGSVRDFDQIKSMSLDVIFVTEPKLVPILLSSTAELKIFYAVLQQYSVKKVSKLPDVVTLTNSEGMYQYLGGSKKKYLWNAPGGIDTNKFEYKPRDFSRTPNKPFVVLVYGRFYKRKKGTLLVVRACEQLYKQGYNIKLLLFDSPMNESSRDEVKNFTCSVPFEFFVDYPVKDIQEIFYRADVFVSAERKAGWSNTTIEAMACGVPVIATRSGTQDFLFHEKTGLVVWRHPWFIRKAIKRIIANPKLAKEWAVNAKQKINEFTWESLADRIEELAISRLKS